ncbi:DUF2303 family protein [Mycobacteroides abscessus]|uniref:DUF2303 family protein n=1 Tax=Mycobacteroides abscessus TaxID=36809 RepID=UPI0018968A6B
MPENTIELPDHTVETIDSPNQDGPIYLVTANGERGLEAQVVDVRKEAPQAFPPRAVASRTVTDSASLLAEVERRPLVENISTAWGNRNVGEITIVYDELEPDANFDYTNRADVLRLKFVRDPDWDTLFRAADGEFHRQEEFGDLIEQAGHLIISHPAAELMEIVDSIRTSSSGSFKSQIKRDTGSQHLSYSEEVTASAGTASRELEVPREIALAARPFEDYPLVEIACWLRLRVANGNLYLALIPKPYEHLVRDAWTQKTGELSDQLGVPVYASNLGK